MGILYFIVESKPVWRDCVTGLCNGLVPSGNKPLPIQCWPRAVLLYGVPRPQWLKWLNVHVQQIVTATNLLVLDVANTLWPSDAIWRQRSWSTLAQVMACCLMTVSHYLNQCWLFITKVQWHLSKANFRWKTWTINHQNQLENYLN